MPNENQRELIVSNANRLLADAQLLLDHHRYPSAFALAVLGMEEIGKALLKEWQAEKPLARPRKGMSMHVQKQTAVSSLLLGAMMAQRFPQRPPNLHSVDVDALTKEFNESDAGQLFARIRDSQLEKRKQGALYQDDVLIAVEADYAEMHVKSIFQIVNDARNVLTDKVAQAPARAFYETTLKSDGER
jgi:AbiV family abortive infection protein